MSKERSLKLEDLQKLKRSLNMAKLFKKVLILNEKEAEFAKKFYFNGQLPCNIKISNEVKEVAND